MSLNVFQVATVVAIMLCVSLAVGKDGTEPNILETLQATCRSLKSSLYSYWLMVGACFAATLLLWCLLDGHKTAVGEGYAAFCRLDRRVAELSSVQRTFERALDDEAVLSVGRAVQRVVAAEGEIRASHLARRLDLTSRFRAQCREVEEALQQVDASPPLTPRRERSATELAPDNDI